MVHTRRELAIFLSQLQVFDKPNIRLEQYPSDGNTAAKLLWQAHLQGDLENHIIVDLGCGTGLLGIGALLLGAAHVVFIDIDPNVKRILDQNMDFLEEHYEVPGTWEFRVANVKGLHLTDINEDMPLTVITNPPFGTKIKHADKDFLETGIRLADTVYSMHKTTTRKFLDAFAKDHNLSTWYEEVSFPLQNTMAKHRKNIERIEVVLVCFKKLDA